MSRRTLGHQGKAQSLDIRRWISQARVAVRGFVPLNHLRDSKRGPRLTSSAKPRLFFTRTYGRILRPGMAAGVLGQFPTPNAALAGSFDKLNIRGRKCKTRHSKKLDTFMTSSSLQDFYPARH
jgi:hypothetical protein